MHSDLSRDPLPKNRTAAPAGAAWSGSGLRKLIVSVIVPTLFMFPHVVLGDAQSPKFGGAKAAGFFAGSSHGKSERLSLLEGRPGYLWGVNEFRYRDGDNPNLAPGKKEVSLQSPIFGVHGEMFARRDVSVRVQGWLNAPMDHRGDFYLDHVARQWNTSSRFMAADISAVYHFGALGRPPGRMPTGGVYNRDALAMGPGVFAGLVAGYRYNRFEYWSATIHDANGQISDSLNVHVPYVGVSYADGNFIGSVLRLDLSASPVTLARLDTRELLLGTVTTIDGHAVTGFWFQSLLGWFWPVADKALFGAFVDYSFLELSGGATLKRGPASTRFSLDSRHHVLVTGLTLNYTF